MLVLASASPRRASVLGAAGIPFTVRVSPVEEARLPGETPRDYVCRLARAKAESVQRNPGEIVLGADTIVVIDGRILVKPSDAAEASAMLHLLGGRTHQVLTGICLASDRETIVDCEVTQVSFLPLSGEEIRDYVASGEPAGKAGAYAIQGLASRFIDRIEGCYFNVVGLPVSNVWRHLRGMSEVPYHRI